MKENVDKYIQDTQGFTAEQILQYAYKQFGERLALATSMGEEDQVLTDLISTAEPRIKLFSLDTGRLFQESYDLLAKTQKRYPMTIDIYYPDTSAAEEMVKDKGVNLFYDSIENRKTCCGVRKVEPLKRGVVECGRMDYWFKAITVGHTNEYEDV